MYDMTIRLQQNSEKCLYEQIYEHIRREISEGELLAGERLPSTRSLADYLQVSRSTVECAYDQLLSEGYIEARPYKGYFVCPVEELFSFAEKNASGKKKEDVRTQRSERFTVEDAGDARMSVRADDAADDGVKEQACSCAYDFSPHGLDMSVFPFGVWKRITRNILNDGNSELFARGEPQGDYDLRYTICRYLHSSRGVNCTPDRVIVGAGNDYLLMLLEKILGHDVGIAMENPTYMRTYRIFKSFGYQVSTVPMDENGIRIPELEKSGARVAYVMPSHQFPTGTVTPIGRRMELLKWADGPGDRYLIEDDYDSEFRYRGKPIPSLQSCDERGRVIYIGTFSKAIAPAIRVSYMVLPEALMRIYRRDCYFYSCTVSRIDQRILNEFIRDGYFERHLNKMRKRYRIKHDLLLQELLPFEKKFRKSGEHGGLHLVLTARGKDTETKLLESAAKAGVKVYGMSENCVEAVADRATILLGFGGLSEREIREGIGKLKEAWL